MSDNAACIPSPCKQLNADHGDYLGLLRRLRKLPGVKKVFVRSGIRFDFALADEEHGDAFLRELCAYHVSGQLRVAPEHVSDAVLSVMGKPRNLVYQRFSERFTRVNEQLDKKQYLVHTLTAKYNIAPPKLFAAVLRIPGYMMTDAPKNALLFVSANK